MISKAEQKRTNRERRHRRIRARVFGTASRPRLSVYKSNRYLYAQLIDDEKGVTIAAAHDLGQDSKVTKKERAEAVGKEIAERGKEKGISNVVFDRGGFIFTGRIRLTAEAARKGGMLF